MKFSTIMGNSQKLDGGAMFGNAPKALWSRWVEPDALNRIDLACRALLVETENHRILFETGIGVYMAPKLRERYGVRESEHVLLDSLAELDLSHEDIDVVILSHLHFDHAGGLLTAYRSDQPSELLFPNADFYVGEQAWIRAENPHPRDRASFVPELNALLKASGRLRQLKNGARLQFDELAIGFFPSEGHTPGMMCADLSWPGGRMVFAADLIPGRPWVHLPITMGYDRYPERLIDEKEALLSSLAEDGGWLFFTHDAEVSAATVMLQPEKKKFMPDKTHDVFRRTAL